MVHPIIAAEIETILEKLYVRGSLEATGMEEAEVEEHLTEFRDMLELSLSRMVLAGCMDSAVRQSAAESCEDEASATSQAENRVNARIRRNVEALLRGDDAVEG